MKLKVVGARCIIKEHVAEEKTKSGIIIANTSAHEPKFTGTILAVGEGAFLESGALRPMSLKVGDTVMYAKFSGTPIHYDDQEYIVLNERDILAYIRDEEEA